MFDYLEIMNLKSSVKVSPAIDGIDVEIDVIYLHNLRP